MAMSIQSLDHLVLTMADLDKTVAFYESVLGMISKIKILISTYVY